MNYIITNYIKALLQENNCEEIHMTDTEMLFGKNGEGFFLSDINFKYEAKNNVLIINDDYESVFVYLNTDTWKLAY